MSRHLRFADGAGFTRHCWECKHATNWRNVNTIDGYEADCEQCGIKVSKYDSPNNSCCHLPWDCDYETNAHAERLRGEGESE